MNTQSQDLTELAAVAGERVTPPVPIGLSTIVGLTTATVAGLVAATTAFLSGDHSAETIGAMIAGAIVLYGVIRGRSDQAAARNLPAPPLPAIPQPVTLNYAPARRSAAEELAVADELAQRVAERHAAPAGDGAGGQIPEDVSDQAALQDVDGDLGDDDQPTARDLRQGPTDLDHRAALAHPVDDEPEAAR